MKSKKKKTKGERRKILHQNLVAYSFLAPSLIGVICFSLIPLIISLYVSLEFHRTDKLYQSVEG